VLPGPLSGLAADVEVPTSKSITNRALIAAAASGGGRIERPLDCDDTRVLAEALRTAGWHLEWGSAVEVGGRTIPDEPPVLDLADSGTGARLLLGLLSVTPGGATITGSARLRERPMSPLCDALAFLGARIRSTGGRLPVSVEGAELEGGALTLRPESSSQFVSSLLLAAPLMRRGLDLVVEGSLPSAPYLDLTEDVLRAFGSTVLASADRRRWTVPPGSLRPAAVTVEGDWSAAAFALAAVAVAGGCVAVGPLHRASRQGDRAIVGILGGAGLDLGWEGERLVARGPLERPIVADLRHTPDLFPALAAVAACAPPGSMMSGLEHLAHKESDRLRAMVENLGRLGAELEVTDSTLAVVSGLERVDGPPRPVVAEGDHRIAMAMAVAALGGGALALDDGSCVGKSFPDFWDMWARLTEPAPA
jgi:3-phosphoshikimate 1-carboxyvinyltransferase